MGNREAAIARREERWQKKMHIYITKLLDDYQKMCDDEQESKTNAKTKQLLEWKEVSKKRSNIRQNNELLEENRQEKINKRSQKRLQDEMTHVEELEEDLEYKLECIENGIPTKVTLNDLVKSLVPVLAISELFCAVKSELDEISYLKNVELEPLAKLTNLPPLLYVKQLNEEHEKNRLPVPSAVPLTSST